MSQRSQQGASDRAATELQHSDSQHPRINGLAEDPCMPHNAAAAGSIATDSADAEEAELQPISSFGDDFLELPS